jgi:hypothetical protein
MAGGPSRPASKQQTLGQGLKLNRHQEAATVVRGNAAVNGTVQRYL